MDREDPRESEYQKKEEYQSIAVIENVIEGQLIGSILEDQGIPHRIRSFHDTAYDGLYQLQKGWGDILAPAENGPEILEILDKVRSDAQSPD